MTTCNRLIVLAFLMCSLGAAIGCTKTREPSHENPDAAAVDAAQPGTTVDAATHDGSYEPGKDSGADSGNDPSCRQQSTENLRLFWHTSAAFPRVSYEGDAVVERSTHDELVLYLPGNMQVKDDAGASDSLGGVRSVLHATNLPLLARGTKLWLRDDQAQQRVPYGPPIPSHHSLRTEANGSRRMSAIDSHAPPANAPISAINNREGVTTRKRSL